MKQPLTVAVPDTIRAFRFLPNCGKCGNCVDNAGGVPPARSARLHGLAEWRALPDIPAFGLNMKRVGDILPPELARTLGAVKSASPALALGIAAFDEEMKGGIPTSALTELFGETGQGAWWLGFKALAAVREKAVAIIEPAGTFFAPGAASVGVDLSRLLVLRESNRRQALWALERIVKDKSVGATLAHIEGMGETEMRRLQLAAEASGQALLLLREEQRLSRASWGALRLRVSSEPGAGERRIIVETLRARGGFAPRPILIEIEHGTMAVRASSVLPHRTESARLSRTA